MSVTASRHGPSYEEMRALRREQESKRRIRDALDREANRGSILCIAVAWTLFFVVR
jgi:hypothetical protein